MSQTQSRKRGGSSPPKNAAASSSQNSSSTTSQTVYERQEIETRTRRTPTTSATSSPDLNSTGTGLAGSPFSRQQEKDELKFLNSRLANYIDTIRNQEEEIVVLRKRVESINTTEAQEARRLSDKYGKEIDNLRKALDQVSKEQLQAATERDSLLSERKDQSAKNSSLEAEKKLLQQRLRDAEAALKDVRAQLAALQEEMRDHNNQIAAAEARVRELEAQTRQLKDELSAETVKRVDAENRLMSVQEDLRFQKGLHDEQMSMLRNQRVVEVSEVERRLHDDYNSRVADQLNDLRDEMEYVARSTREDLERNYVSQIQDLQDLATRNADDSRHVLEELRSTQSRIKEMQGKSDRQNQEYRTLIGRLEADIKAKDGDVQRLTELLAARQLELQRASSDLHDMQNQYNELYGEKINLDAELAIYHKLLLTEEQRLNLTSGTFPSTPTGTPVGRGTKRTRHSHISRTSFRNEASAKGHVHIAQIDEDGQFVRLENKSDQDVLVGGWMLYMSSDGGADNETRYKIHSNTVLKGKTTMTIWSANTNVVHDPPSDIVMEGRWLIGNSTTVSLTDSAGDEVAARRMYRSAGAGDSFDSSPYAKRTRASLRGDCEGDAQKNCTIM